MSYIRQVLLCYDVENKNPPNSWLITANLFLPHIFCHLIWLWLCSRYLHPRTQTGGTTPILDMIISWQREKRRKAEYCDAFSSFYLNKVLTISHVPLVNAGHMAGRYTPSTAGHCMSQA